MYINKTVFLIFENNSNPYWKTAVKGGLLGAGLGTAKGLYKSSYVVNPETKEKLSISKFKKQHPDDYNAMKDTIPKERARNVKFYGATGLVGGTLGSLAARKLKEVYKKRKQKHK